MHLINNVLEARKCFMRQCKGSPNTFKRDDMILVDGSYGLVKALVFLGVVNSSCNLAVLTFA